MAAGSFGFVPLELAVKTHLDDLLNRIDRIPRNIEEQFQFVFFFFSCRQQGHVM